MKIARYLPCLESKVVFPNFQSTDSQSIARLKQELIPGNWYSNYGHNMESYRLVQPQITLWQSNIAMGNYLTMKVLMEVPMPCLITGCTPQDCSIPHLTHRWQVYYLQRSLDFLFNFFCVWSNPTEYPLCRAHGCEVYKAFGCTKNLKAFKNREWWHAFKHGLIDHPFFLWSLLWTQQKYHQ